MLIIYFSNVSDYHALSTVLGRRYFVGGRTRKSKSDVELFVNYISRVVEYIDLIYKHVSQRASKYIEVTGKEIFLVYDIMIEVTEGCIQVSQKLFDAMETMVAENNEILITDKVIKMVLVDVMNLNWSQEYSDRFFRIDRGFLETLLGIKAEGEELMLLDPNRPTKKIRRKDRQRADKILEKLNHINLKNQKFSEEVIVVQESITNLIINVLKIFSSGDPGRIDVDAEVLRAIMDIKKHSVSMRIIRSEISNSINHKCFVISKREGHSVSHGVWPIRTISEKVLDVLSVIEGNGGFLGIIKALRVISYSDCGLVGYKEKNEVNMVINTMQEFFAIISGDVLEAIRTVTGVVVVVSDRMRCVSVGCGEVSTKLFRAMDVIERDYKVIQDIKKVLMNVVSLSYDDYSRNESLWIREEFFEIIRGNREKNVLFPDSDVEFTLENVICKVDDVRVLTLANNIISMIHSVQEDHRRVNEQIFKVNEVMKEFTFGVLISVKRVLERGEVDTIWRNKDIIIIDGYNISEELFNAMLFIQKHYEVIITCTGWSIIPNKVITKEYIDIMRVIICNNSKK